MEGGALCSVQTVICSARLAVCVCWYTLLACAPTTNDIHSTADSGCVDCYVTIFPATIQVDVCVMLFSYPRLPAAPGAMISRRIELGESGSWFLPLPSYSVCVIAVTLPCCETILL